MLTTTTHLNLPGTARAALDFYQGVFGGQVFATTYGELGMPAELPDAGKVVFGALQAENGFRIMAYDIPGRTDPVAGSTRRENGTTITDQPFFVSLRAGSLDEATGYWEGLADGASVIEPLAASAWSAGFGMLTDRFGITWAFDVEAAQAG
ncbi:VOC family protein [Leifsonia sp. NPDC058194]|uniref:VOC family protein n=1 Tax=Leifsonia sp. NPDC058194 TaxID=3346374 RepID=UPI0036DC0A7D